MSSYIEYSISRLHKSRHVSKIQRLPVAFIDDHFRNRRVPAINKEIDAFIDSRYEYLPLVQLKSLTWFPRIGVILALNSNCVDVRGQEQ